MKGLLSSVAIIAFTLACGQPEAKPEAPPPQTPAVSIGSLQVSRQTIVEPVFGTGTIAAHKTTDVGPRVDGIIEEIYVSVGDRVAAGAPLFRTRPIDYRIRVQEAKQALRLARAEAEKSERDENRIERLYKQGVASDEQLDESRTVHEIASARLGSAGAVLARVQQDLADTVVKAPYAGVITGRYVDEGVMFRTIRSGGSQVIQIMKTDILAAIVQIPSVHLPLVHLGTPAQLQIAGMTDTYESSVAILNDRVDPTSRAFEVRIPIENPDLEIKPGLFVRARFSPEPRTVLVLDRRAVQGLNGARYVFVAEHGKAARRPVIVRDLDSKRIEVLEGLEPGQRVLAGPALERLREGTPVQMEVADVAF